MMKSVIELVKTTQGYSIVEDNIEVNKVSGRPVKEKHYNSAPKKFTPQNFTIYPYVYCHQTQMSQKYIIVPAKSQWFSLNQVHQIEKKALPQWFKTKKVVFGAAVKYKFQKNQELYKKYRNYIIQLGRNEYVSPTRARKGLAGDVSSILRIHSFLQKNGLINYVFSKNKTNKCKSQNLRQQQNVIKLSKRKDCMDKDKLVFDKHFDKDHLQLLKKITKRYRPICHLCEGICGVLWYQYQQELVLKSFQKQQIQNSNQQRKQNRKQSQKVNKNRIIKAQQSFKYLLRLCAYCFTSGNLPIILSLDDFKKITIINRLPYQYEEPKQKRKLNQQNKLIQLLQRNRFNLKKTAQALKISQKDIFIQLLCLPIIKIQKLARIDPESDEQEVQERKNADYNHLPVQNSINAEENHKNENIEKTQDEQIINNYEKQLEDIQQQQIKLHEQLIQVWLMKISAKLLRLSDWEKSTQWYASRLIYDQKNTLAEILKNKN